MSPARLLSIALLPFITLATAAPRAFAQYNPASITAPIDASNDVAWLEILAAADEATVKAAGLQPKNLLASGVKDLRTAAYVRLGTLGTKDALAAIERIEAAARKIPLNPPTVRLDTWPHPCWHFGDEPHRPLAQSKAPDGTTFAFINSSHLGANDLFLISSKTPDDPKSWSRPLLLDLPAPRDNTQPSLAMIDDHTLLVSFIPNDPDPRAIKEGIPAKPQILDLNTIRKDSDKDGITDIEERRLGLDPNNPDSDKDGIKDGDDHSPDIAPAPDNRAVDTDQIIQRAVFATFGISGARYLLLADPQTPQVHLWGYAGPVLYKKDAAQWRRDHGHGAISVGWSVKVDGDTATVDITDYESPTAASGQTVTLRKIAGQWYVVKRQLGPVA